MFCPDDDQRMAESTMTNNKNYEQFVHCLQPAILSFVEKQEMLYKND